REARKGLLCRRGVEAPMGDRVLAGRAGDLAAARERHRRLGRLAEAWGGAGGDVQDARRAMLEHGRDEAGDVPDEDVVALLLSLAEERDRLAADGRARKAVGAVAVVRVTGAV